MARVLITGSADGLGLAAAETLLGDGHEVIVHARGAERLPELGTAGVVGDLADQDQTRALADQVNAWAGRRRDPQRRRRAAARDVMAVNVVAPYLLTALVHRPQRLVYLSSGMHSGGRAQIRDLRAGSYSDSKLLVTRSPSPSAAYGRTCAATPWTRAGCPRRWAAEELPTTSGSAT